MTKRNRSLAFLKTKQFVAALSDFGYPDSRRKGAVPRRQSPLQYREIRKCCQVLEQLRTNFPQTGMLKVVP